MNATLIHQILWASLGIHLLTHLLVPLNIRLSRRWGIVALPNERRIHSVPTPEAGGLSFALPLILALVVIGLAALPAQTGKMMLLLAGVGLLTVIFGVLDDKYESQVRYKLYWQIAIGIAMYLIGFRISSLTNPLGADFILGWLSFPATVIWYLVVLNAINLIDGIDGLAAGVCIIVCAVLLAVGIKENNFLVAALSSFLLAGNLAFLRFNFHPAKIFMGETGAEFNGLIIAAIATTGTTQYKGITSMTLIIPLSALAIPLIDMVLALYRRIRRGSLVSQDKNHLHHTMLDFGLSQTAVSLIVYLVTLMFGLIAIGFSFSSKRVLLTVLLGLLTLTVVVAYILMRLEKKK